MPKQTYVNCLVSYLPPQSTQRLTYTALNVSSKQAACRRALKYWISSGMIKSQPKTVISDSSFDNVNVEVF